MAYSVHIRVLDKDCKTKYSHFFIERFQRFHTPVEVKRFFVANHKEMIKPATEEEEFKFGFFIEARGNQKFEIVDEKTLSQAYDKSQNNRLTLWIDPQPRQARGANKRVKQGT